MKRLLPILLAIIITLSACSVKAGAPLECVADTLCEVKTPSYYIAADYPADSALAVSCNNGCCALFTGTDYEIYQEIFRTDSVEDAFLHLTGRNLAELSPIRVGSFPYEEYRFACTATGESGILSCIGKLFYDGDFCYAITVSYPIDKEKDYSGAFADLIATASVKAV